MKILVTGANGMVARAVIAHGAELGDQVLTFARDEFDISDREKAFRILGEHSPAILFNCAAFTDVDGAESNEKAAYAANAAGPENLAAASREFGTTFVTISTDYVFDGAKDGFYSEDDLPNPQSVYARSKYEGEQRSAAENPDSILVRSGWIFGRGGTNFLSTVAELLSSGKRLNAIEDSFGTPTFAGDLAVRLRELATRKGAGIFHVVNSGPGASYHEFAVKAASILGISDAEVNGVSDLDMKRPAPRPRNSRLICLRTKAMGLAPLRNWEAALADFLKGVEF